MTKSGGLYNKLFIVLIGVFIGIGSTFMLDKYREQQTTDYIGKVFSSMQDNDWQNNNTFKNFGNRNVKLINTLGKLENYSITANDASYNFNNELGLHTVALVRTEAKYEQGSLNIIFNIFKKNGQWSINKVYISQHKKT
ncbi:MAG: hypothetical protein HRT87_10725 [Legionellales bacterium]|nr:hypothetical protein [Legionellales bacterium]